jgi:hypothetical protein
MTKKHNFELWNFIETEFLKANPVRNSSRCDSKPSGALNPAGIILKSDPAAEQWGIISNGVNII